MALLLTTGITLKTVHGFWSNYKGYTFATLILANQGGRAHTAYKREVQTLGQLLKTSMPQAQLNLSHESLQFCKDKKIWRFGKRSKRKKGNTCSRKASIKEITELSVMASACKWGSIWAECAEPSSTIQQSWAKHQTVVACKTQQLSWRLFTWPPRHPDLH